MCRCLYCYKELRDGEKNFHSACARRFFGTQEAPVLAYARADMDALAKEIIATQTTLTGVQPKISLHLQDHEGSKRLTIVGLWGGYIFKPQTEDYPHLPEVEDLTMHLAEQNKIDVVPHSLIRLADGELGYIARRIDRISSSGKVAMEDMCQLSERPTEYKYKKGSLFIQSMQVSLDIIHVNRIKIVYYSGDADALRGPCKSMDIARDADALVRGQFGTN